MTVQETIQELAESLNDRQAQDVLDFMRQVIDIEQHLDEEEFLSPASTVLDRAGQAEDESPSFSMADPLWQVVGMGRTDEPTDIARDKDDLIAHAVHAHRR